MSVDTQDKSNGTAFKFPVPRPDSSDIAKKIEMTFDRMGYRSLRDVYCESDSGRITLRGITPTFYLKQVAQVIAAKVAGVGMVINQIEVLAEIIADSSGIFPPYLLL